MTTHVCPECECEFGEEADDRVSKRVSKRYHRKRWACDVLEEMRQIVALSKEAHHETLACCIEELQYMVNSMESSLAYRRDINDWIKEAREISEKVDMMQDEAHKMGVILDAQKYNSLEQDVLKRED